jgi:hypothetical protein
MALRHYQTLHSYLLHYLSASRKYAEMAGLSLLCTVGCFALRLSWLADNTLHYIKCINVYKYTFPSFLLVPLDTGPPLWSSGQSSWLQIQRSGFDSRHYQIFWEVMGLERGPLSLVSTIEELLDRKNSGSGLENREYGCKNPSRWPRSTLYQQKLALTSPTSGGRSVGIVRSRIP